MGFHDAAWAYRQSLPSAQKCVLAAIAFRTDDSTHQTFVGQETLAQMVGMNRTTINRTMGALEQVGLIRRERRRRLDGRRNSDLITVANVADANVGETNVGGTNVRDDPDERWRGQQDHSDLDHSGEGNANVSESDHGAPGFRPSPYCSAHPGGTERPCRACGEARRASEAWMPPKPRGWDCALDGHKLTADGTCAACEYRGGDS